MGTHYSNKEREALGIFHCHCHYCFTCEVGVMTDYKPLEVIFNKDVANLSYRLKRILLQIHPFNIKNTIQAWGTTIHFRLAIQTQP